MHLNIYGKSIIYEFSSKFLQLRKYAEPFKPLFYIQTHTLSPDKLNLEI